MTRERVRLTTVQAELQGHLNIKLNSLHIYSFKNHLNTFVELFTSWPLTEPAAWILDAFKTFFFLINKLFEPPYFNYWSYRKLLSKATLFCGINKLTIVYFPFLFL